MNLWNIQKIMTLKRFWLLINKKEVDKAVQLSEIKYFNVYLMEPLEAEASEAKPTHSAKVCADSLMLTIRLSAVSGIREDIKQILTEVLREGQYLSRKDIEGIRDMLTEIISSVSPEEQSVSPEAETTHSAETCVADLISMIKLSADNGDMEGVRQILTKALREGRHFSRGDIEQFRDMLAEVVSEK